MHCQTQWPSSLCRLNLLGDKKEERNASCEELLRPGRHLGGSERCGGNRMIEYSWTTPSPTFGTIYRTFVTGI